MSSGPVLFDCPDPRFAAALAAVVPDVRPVEPSARGRAIVVRRLPPSPESAWTVRNFRRRAECAWTPAVLFGERAALKGSLGSFALGADQYVPEALPARELPAVIARAEEEVGKIREALSVQSRFRPTKSPPGARGALDAVGLGPLLVYLEETAQSGILTLVREPDDRQGQLFFRRGRVVRASEAAALSRNAEAVVEMLRWGAGTFEFNAREVSLEDQVASPARDLLWRAR